MKKRILLVEDDRNLSRVLADSLTCSGFDVERAEDGDQAIERFRTFRPDLVVLDVMLPGMSGFELCGLMRRAGQTPVIMLTAREEKADKIRALELGADDYVTKPFDFDELRARMHAVLRRARLDTVQLTLGSVTIDFEKLTAHDGEREIHLTRREFELLSYLAERRGAVVRRGELLRALWGYPREPKTRAVDYAIKRLREKIEPDPHHPHFIHTVHGDGYCLTAAPASSHELE
jgi:two-component system response regulator VicR